MRPDYPTTLEGQFRRHLPKLLAGTLVLAIFQWAMNRIDWRSKQAIDFLFSAAPKDAAKPALLMLGFAVVAFVARIASRWYIFNTGRDVEYELRSSLLAKLQELGSSFYRRMPVGEIMSRSTNDLTQVRLLFGFGALNVINVVFAFASALQVMATISLKLTLVAFIPLPLLLLTSRQFGKAMYTKQRANQASIGKLSEVLQSNLAGVRVVRSFALEPLALARFREANRSYLEASLGLARLRGVMIPIMGATGGVGILLIYWYGGTLLLRGVEHGGISKGDFFAFSLAHARMTWPMIALGFVLSILQRGRAGFARLQEVFDAVPDVTDGLETISVPNPSLSVRHLTFRHKEQAVLADVSFELASGHSLAVVGRTASGKSTLALLLARLLPTPEGTVFVGDKDVCSLDLGELRRIVGYAQQDAFLFSTTVTRNVGFSIDDPDADTSVELIRKSASEAQILEEIDTLPDGFDTVVGERGVQLSGGQKQRIALARSLARKSSILVLDDPLSAVDAKTEAAILDALDRQKKNRTVLLITHRVAAAARCDKIVVLDHGKVVAFGTHSELLAAGGLYAAFAEEQRLSSALAELASTELEALEPSAGAA